jgi:hypothetical protein
LGEIAHQVNQEELNQEPNESTDDSKKMTVASSNQELKSELSEAVLCDDKSYLPQGLHLERQFPLNLEYDVNHIKDSIFDLKAHHEGAEPGAALLKPECLSLVNLQNEMSYQDPKHDSDSLFHFNIKVDEAESCHDEEIDGMSFTQGKVHSKTFQEDDFGLRVESKRAGFANKYLFNQNPSNYSEIEEANEDDYSENEDSYCSENFSNSP